MLGRSRTFDEDVVFVGKTASPLKSAIVENAKKNGVVLKPREIEKYYRSILANREIAATVAKIKALGSDAVYFPVDVCDLSELSEALDFVRKEIGPIEGIIHGAGVIHDKLIRDKTQEQFDAVMRTKVLGATNLLNATQSDRLKSICFFSSVAGRTGNSGQSDYAMANEVLNKLALFEAASRRESGCNVHSIGWGPGRQVTKQERRIPALWPGQNKRRPIL